MATLLLNSLQRDARREAVALLAWWTENLPDGDGGFWGEIDGDGHPVADAPLSAVLITRLLWFFSAAGRHLDDTGALAAADTAAAYLRRHFLTPGGDGLHWLVDRRGRVLDDRRPTIAHASAIHALAQHYAATGNGQSLDAARRLLAAAERKAWDTGCGGYRDTVGGSRTDKGLGANLHLMEAHTVLHRSAPDEASFASLDRALTTFLHRFAGANHVSQGFNGDWTPWPALVSYGHDAEASWLVWEAARAHGDVGLLAQAHRVTLTLAEQARLASATGTGGIPFCQTADGIVDPAGEWWGQAEGLVAFVNAWRLSGDRHYLHAAERLWAHVSAHHGAGQGREWSWYAANSGKASPYLAGAWKCPYHTGRAMIELDRRLDAAAPLTQQ